MKALLKTSLIVVILGVWSLISSPAQTALPDDISITPPSSAVATNAAAFSGAWLGAWGGELSTALIVEQINSNGTARVIYSWGDLDLPTNGFKTGWERQTWQLSNGDLHLSSKIGHDIDFTVTSSGLLLGRYEMKDTPAVFAELHRIPSTNALAIREAAKKIGISWEEIRIPVHSQIGPTKGKTFALQTTVYHQSSGKHPLVIFNHGSTGPGIVPANYVYRCGNEAQFFHSLGYVVAVPMRKGRGHSEGPYLEEDDSVPIAIGLDSAVEDLHAVIECMSAQSDVDPARIVLAGASRGGFLSVVYAGRYPSNIIGVLNFSGGWFAEGMPTADFNFENFGQAGRDAKIPMLWLYGDHDSCYSLGFDEREFSKFKDAGGRGELVEVRDIPGDGHGLVSWVDRWRDKVATYLNGL